MNSTDFTTELVYASLKKLGLLTDGERLQDQTQFDTVFKNGKYSRIIITIDIYVNCQLICLTKARYPFAGSFQVIKTLIVSLLAMFLFL
jgi:hypothetical protein